MAQSGNNPYPLQHSQDKFTGKSPSATTDEAQRYKDLLGFSAAGEDVGLFYQLNQIAAAEPEEVEAYTNSGSRQLQNISRYGNYAEPIEAGGKYA